MAVIAGKVPPPADLPAEYQPRVVVKFRPDVNVPHARGAAEKLADRERKAWKELTDAVPGLTLEPYFASLGETALRAMSAAPAGAPEEAESAPRLTSYFVVTCPRGADPQKVVKAVAGWAGVETAYVEAGPTPPPVNPGDDPRNVNQRYQDAAPVGIDARWAWGAADGSGVGFVDLERGWTLNHEDLAAAGITLISGVNTDYPGHGTAVLGEVVGVDNTRGGVGIAPRATARVVSQWRTASNYNTADAIVSAAAAMAAGDVLLLEAQTSHPNATGYVPVEVEQATFDAIRAATNKGIVVVEAGANGSVDLDAFKDSNGKRILNRNSADFRDSGAVLVGAASSAAPHARLGFSNFGSRIDCYAWGENIDTTGDGWTGTGTTTYTSFFGGTSGATPIVTGAAVLLQSWRVRRGLPRYTPGALRALLSDTSLNTPSANPTNDKIGVMPNLRAIIERQGLFDAIRDDRWRLVVQILFGVTQDGGGVIIIPGKGPVPVDPWGPRVAHLAAEKRDILVGLALTELSSLMGDGASRREMDRAALGSIRKSLDALSRKDAL